MSLASRASKWPGQKQQDAWRRSYEVDVVSHMSSFLEFSSEPLLSVGTRPRAPEFGARAQSDQTFADSAGSPPDATPARRPDRRPRLLGACRPSAPSRRLVTDTWREGNAAKKCLLHRWLYPLVLSRVGSCFTKGAWKYTQGGVGSPGTGFQEAGRRHRAERRREASV